MLLDDFETIEGYFDFVCIRPSVRDAWNNIKMAMSAAVESLAEEHKVGQEFCDYVKKTLPPD